MRKVSAPYNPPHLMAFVEMVTQLILTIEHPATTRLSAGEEGTIVFLHVATVLLTTTKRTKTAVRALRSCNGGMLNLVVECRVDGCKRNVGLKLRWCPIRHYVRVVGLWSDGNVDGLWDYSVGKSLVGTVEANDIGK